MTSEIVYKLALWFGIFYNSGMYADPLDERLRAARRNHYHNNKERYKQRNADRKAKMRELLVEHKNRPCMDCGNFYPSYVMDLDHRDPTQKIAEVGKFIANGNMAGFLAELEKCDVVCANCHRIRTHAG